MTTQATREYDSLYDSLYDSETNAYVSAADLGISDERYEELVQESASTGTAEGHVTFQGRRYYAST